MFANVLLTIYLYEAPSDITFLALFPENKKAVSTKLEFPENKKCNADSIGIFSKIAFKEIHPAINGMGRSGYRKQIIFFLGLNTGTHAFFKVKHTRL
jgi:hypothetical protein